jgi:hypothetical protein
MIFRQMFDSLSGKPCRKTFSGQAVRSSCGHGPEAIALAFAAIFLSSSMSDAGCLLDRRGTTTLATAAP